MPILSQTEKVVSSQGVLNGVLSAVAAPRVEDTESGCVDA